LDNALTLLDPDEPPTVARFRELCASAPSPAFRAGPEPKQPQRTAEVRRKYLRPVASVTGRERAWAARMVQRANAGERVSAYSLRLALDALGRQEPMG
jgi:membrane-bound ClpP family serine protease